MIGLTRALAVAGALAAAALTPAAGANSAIDDPGEIARRIGDSVVADTVFRLEPKPANGLQQGYYPVAMEWGDAGRTVILAADIICRAGCVETPTDFRYAAWAGDLRILLDGREVFRTRIDHAIEARERDYNVVDAPIAKANVLANGGARLVITFKPASDAGFVMPGLTLGNGSGAQELVVLAPPGLPESTLSPSLRARAAPDKELRAALAQLDGPDAEKTWQPVAAVETLDNPDPLALSDWRYFSGALLSSMMAAGDRFKHPQFGDFVSRHVAFFLDNVKQVRAERSAKHQLDGPFAHYFRFTLLDDVGPQSAALAEWNARQPAATRDSRIDANTTAAIEAILRVPRLTDGTMARITPVRHTVWADDLYMGGASLARIGRLQGRPDLIDEAARQALLFDKHLRDVATGLYYHGWDDAAGRHSSSKWARANGWTMLAKAEVLESLAAGHPDRAALLRAFSSHARALAKVQATDGRWHQVLDNPATYLETPASAMFVAAMAEGVTRGWLDAREFDPVIACGWKAVAGQVRPDGRVTGIVVGTPILANDGEYDRQKTRLNDPRGVPAVLFASIAVADWRARGAPHQGCN